RTLPETPRFAALARESSGRLVTETRFWEGFVRLTSNRTMLVRLIGASAAWFLMDAAYYGNTVSSPRVLAVLHGGEDLRHRLLTQLVVFCVFALPGYIVAVATMDRLGRKLIQSIGFGVMTVCFALLAFLPDIASRT